jgi:hypothetical protein
MADPAAASSIDWGLLAYQIVIGGCAIGGLILSIKNYFDRKSDSKPDLKLILGKWLDTTNPVKQNCIRCIIANQGKIPVKYEKLGLFMVYKRTEIELHEFKRVAIATESYSGTTSIPDIIKPNDSRMAPISPQKIVRGLEENKIHERNVTLFVRLKPSFGKSFDSNKLPMDLSGIDSMNPDANRFREK